MDDVIECTCDECFGEFGVSEEALCGDEPLEIECPYCGCADFGWSDNHGDEP